jgi:putative cardiolipin synthase
LPQPVALAPELSAPAAEYGSLADVGRRIQGMLATGESAHWLLDRNRLALEARLALADSAASTLDVQYFIWQDDASGELLARRLLAAADRGVRIRLLLDDFTVSSGRGDIARLDAHPRIEVRTFNPWATRSSRFGTAVEFLTRAYTLNRRMHNKTFIADKRFAILGGRNIGDRYFGLYEPFVQNDLDVLVAGPLVGDVAVTFDAFWNSEHSFPVVWFARDPRPLQLIETTRAELDSAVASSSGLLQSFPLEPANWSGYLESLVDDFAAGPGSVVWEVPDILDPNRDRLYTEFKRLVAGAKRELLISSPYFIPDAEFRRILKDLVARGVRVAVVTNSLATNNHVVAHTGYRRWRRDVLASGVELYELRADAAALEQYSTPPMEPAGLGLHTKAFVIDGERAFIGSPNVDPRSMVLNTEIGIVTDSPLLAQRLGDLIRRDMAPENAWRVTLDAEGWLEWANADETVHRQPAKGFLQRTIEFLLNMMPLKRQA